MGSSPYQNTVLQCMDSSHRQVTSSDPKALDPKTSGAPSSSSDRSARSASAACARRLSAPAR